MKLKFIGAAQTVTGSKIEVEHHGFKLLIDCGLFQGPKEIRQLNWDEFEGAETYQAVILTHAHVDHSGYLPKLCKEGFRGPIYCSHATKDLAEILLLDAAYLQEEDARFANLTKHSMHEPALPLYTIEDAQVANHRLQPRSMHEWHVLSPHLSFRFLRAGHILGSCIVQLQYFENESNKIVTFTGDLGGGRSNVIKDPETIIETDYLVCESTYGDRCVPQFNPDELATIISKVISRGGTIVIPAFAVGRTQELLYLIHQLEVQQKIQDVHVYVDSPMAQDVTAVYANYDWELKAGEKGADVEFSLCCQNFHPVKSSDESMLLCMNDSPKIVISASGMLQGGRVLHHLKTKLPQEKNGVLFVGYQGIGTKGRLLKNGLRNIRIHHMNVDVEAEIFSIESLSAHADSDELVGWMKHIQKPPQKTFLVHGEVESQRALYYRVTNELNWDCEIPSPGEIFTLE
ncbi:MAG: MBL fold metallo-hydrolase RNA specificity domain-containing protein [Bdellovibrionia bacterium]